MKGDGKRLGMLLAVVGLALSPFAQAQETFTVVQRKQINYAGTGVSGFLSAIVHDGEVYAGTYANASSGGDNYVYSSYDDYASPVVLAGAGESVYCMTPFTYYGTRLIFAGTEDEGKLSEVWQLTR